MTHQLVACKLCYHLYGNARCFEYITVVELGPSSLYREARRWPYPTSTNERLAQWRGLYDAHCFRRSGCGICQMNYNNNNACSSPSWSTMKCWEGHEVLLRRWLCRPNSWCNLSWIYWLLQSPAKFHLTLKITWNLTCNILRSCVDFRTDNFTSFAASDTQYDCISECITHNRSCVDFRTPDLLEIIPDLAVFQTALHAVRLWCQCMYYHVCFYFTMSWFILILPGFLGFCQVNLF